ncbi:MAG: hypothetical protein OXC11_02650 [Rhodospirillales bacterium]|nr:hypothetical protein [Rhodospirillales bacterium]
MSKQDQFDRVVWSLNEAALDDGLWPATAALLDFACGMRGSALVVGQGRTQADGRIFLTRFCSDGRRNADRERWYFDNYYPIDERVPRVAELADGHVARITDLYTPTELKRSAAYNEALPRGGYQQGLNIRLDGPDGSSIFWNLTDSIEPDGWSSAQVALVRRLLPHLRQYVRVRYSLAAAEGLGASIAALFDSTAIGAVRLDQDGRIVEANDPARRLLRRGDGLSSRSGRLHTLLPADQGRLDALVACALPRFGQLPASGSMTVRRRRGQPALAVHVHPLCDSFADLGIAGRAALVLVVNPESRPVVDPRLVGSALDLTLEESRVAVALAAGDSVRDIATAIRRREHSVHVLLKTIFRKLGIAGSAEIVRLVLPLATLPPPQPGRPSDDSACADD